MPEEIDPRIRKLAIEDPEALFYALCYLREQGVDPIEAGILPSNPVTKKVKSADRWAKQQIDNAKAASADWLDGLKNPSRDPVKAALDKEKKYEDRLQATIKAKKWSKNLAKVTHSEIVEVAEIIGTSGYETGVEARRKKVEKRVKELQPLVQSVSDTIQAMPDGTDAEREKRLTSARKLMIEVGVKRAGA